MAKVLFIVVVSYLSPQEVMNVCQGRAGCAQVQDGKCVMHVLQPQAGHSRDFEVIGHELWHCVHGSYH